MGISEQETYKPKHRKSTRSWSWLCSSTQEEYPTLKILSLIFWYSILMSLKRMAWGCCLFSIFSLHDAFNFKQLYISQCLYLFNTFIECWFHASHLSHAGDILLVLKLWQTSGKVIHLTCKQHEDQCNTIVGISTEMRAHKTAICLNHGIEREGFPSLWVLDESWRANWGYSGGEVRKVHSKMGRKCDAVN